MIGQSRVHNIILINHRAQQSKANTYYFRQSAETIFKFTVVGAQGKEMKVSGGSISFPESSLPLSSGRNGQKDLWDCACVRLHVPKGRAQDS